MNGSEGGGWVESFEKRGWIIIGGKMLFRVLNFLGDERVKARMWKYCIYIIIRSFYGV